MNDLTLPYIPETITVHLGPPDQAAENIRVSFRDYIKNVASSEIYPTWEDAALRANILAQISYALNRIYVQYYRNRGYDFDITASPAFDQKFTRGRDIFENISQLVNQLLQTYIRRIGNIEPLPASFCNGTTVTCAGLSQWGSQDLARQGYGYFEILQYYYGDDIELVSNVPIRGLTPSYPGTPLRLGSAGEAVLQIQGALNRISRNYPAIPKISPLDGLFGPGTEEAVKAFQRIFQLTPDGIVGSDTWYEILSIYVAVTRLVELNSEGQRFLLGSYNLPTVLALGSSGSYVSGLQYMLNVLSAFIPAIPSTAVDGQYGIATRDQVAAYQRFSGLTPSGIVGKATWDSIVNRFRGVDNTVLQNESIFPRDTPAPIRTISDVQRSLQTIAPVFASIDPPRVTGVMDRSTARAVAKLQTQLGQRPTGQINGAVKSYLSTLSAGHSASSGVRFRQYPGYALYRGLRDEEVFREVSDR